MAQRVRQAENRVQWYSEKEYKHPKHDIIEWKIVKVHYSLRDALNYSGVVDVIKVEDD